MKINYQEMLTKDMSLGLTVIDRDLSVGRVKKVGYTLLHHHRYIEVVWVLMGISWSSWETEITTEKKRYYDCDNIKLKRIYVN